VIIREIRGVFALTYCVAYAKRFVILINGFRVRPYNEKRDEISSEFLVLVVRAKVCPGRLAASPLTLKTYGVRKP
jgi:hypothetical protein